MFKKLLILFFTATLVLATEAQEKKKMTPEVFDIWNRVSDVELAQDGSIMVYHLQPGFGDQLMKVTSLKGKQLLEYTRAESSSITWNAKHVVFRIKPATEKVRELQRLKTDKEQMPSDSLGIFDIESGTITKYPHLRDFKIPAEWSGYVAFRVEKLAVREADSDSTAANESANKKTKKMSEKNGYHLILLRLDNGSTDTLAYVKDYRFAKKEPSLMYETTGQDSTLEAGIYHLDLSKGKETPLIKGDHKYKQQSISEDGSQAAFLVDTDTSKALIRDFKLMHWQEGMQQAEIKVSSTDLPDHWLVSQHGNLEFSEDGSKLYFGTSPEPILQDTSVLEDEIIQVEVWSYRDKRLMTQQENNRRDDETKNYLAAYHVGDDRMVQLGTEKVENIRFPNRYKRNSNVLLGLDSQPYYKKVSWEGFPPAQDIYLVDQLDGDKQLVQKETRAYPSISLGGKYLLWYDVEDTAYFVYDMAEGVTRNLSRDIPTSVADERDDHPDYPNPYGIAGWTEDDRYVLIYDRYDVWQVDPSGAKKPVSLTNGRSERIRYRIEILDRENPVIDTDDAIVSIFNEITRAEGFGKLSGSKAVQTLIYDDFAFSRLTKAKNSEDIIYTRSSHREFPDYWSSSLSMKKTIKLTDANPQQEEYRWSTVELVNWTSLDGVELEGLLYKPDGFDPQKKYPMIVYFYERNSDNLHSHSGGFPHRSIIRPTYYASRGYVIFIPDIVYKDGYPGKSCYNAVMPGVTQLISKGFIDEENIGMQGHSWGGYQTAYLATQTDLFACAESGAPVSNMVSAYGGIRWGSGFSRMFQYERTQSRIGGSLWEYPLRYVENSPIFFMDKVNTPILIMHNDEDGAVPWYQGIEMFVALRRLGKPAWMLNYNDEPHWPTKRENIKDFQIRMSQFFDHYLLDKPMPEWMAEGIPAIEKGINKGYELIEKD